MTTRTFALVVFDRSDADWLIEKAARTSVGFDAHLIALHPFSPVVFAAGMSTEPQVIATMLDWEQTESSAIRSGFEEIVRRNALQGEYRAQGNLFGAEGFVLGGARAADLVILGSTASRSPDDRVLAHRVVREAGRPALVLGPKQTFDGPAKRIVVGWTDTREATRAAHDALMLAAPKAEITLVRLHGKASEVPEGMTSREDMAAALDRAGFKVTTLDRPATAEDRAGDLVRVAREVDAQLLATGAFGHSQVYDMLIGAVTRKLLDEAPLPVLLSR